MRAIVFLRFFCFMRYSNVVQATFLRRPNRFVAFVLLDGVETVVHVKNTGRCGELLVPGATVFLAVSDNPLRKTKYDLIAVEKQRHGKEALLVNMDSQVPNEVTAEWLPECGLFSGNAVIRREVSWGKSRFDFYIEDGSRKCFLEVKGCTLEHDGIASFPDAPTERGLKHIHELTKCISSGYEAYVLFVIQMKEMSVFRPNELHDPAFSNALRQAVALGVKIIAMDCVVTPDTVKIDKTVAVDIS